MTPHEEERRIPRSLDPKQTEQEKKKQQKMQASIDEEDRMLSEYEPKVKGKHQIAIGGD